MQQRGSSLYDVMVDYSLLVLEETSPVLVGSSSVIVASDCSCCSIGLGGSSKVVLDSVVPQSLWDAKPLVQMWYAGSSLIVTPGQHTSCAQGLSLVALY